MNPPLPEPDIKVGLSTKLGIIFAILSQVATAAILALEGLPDDAPSAVVIGSLVLAGASAVQKVIDSRGKQASAARTANGLVAAAEVQAAAEVEKAEKTLDIAALKAQIDGDATPPGVEQSAFDDSAKSDARAALTGGEDLMEPEVVALDDPDQQQELPHCG